MKSLSGHSSVGSVDTATIALSVHILNEDFLCACVYVVTSIKCSTANSQGLRLGTGDEMVVLASLHILTDIPTKCFTMLQLQAIFNRSLRWLVISLP